MSGKISYTPEQSEAIRNRGGALLVAAAAGSGKTRVLVERLLTRVETGECDIDDFLVITYTKAAAAELRGKILDGIAERLAENPTSTRLRRQTAICARAQIGTIHSFCTAILRENAAQAGISPEFRVAEDAESTAIKSAVLERLLDRQYETIGDNPDFAALVDMMTAGRDDTKLTEIILDTHGKLLSHPYPDRWVEEQKKRLELRDITDITDTVWGAYLTGKLRRSAEYQLEKLRVLLAECRADPDFWKGYGDSLTETEAQLAEFAASFNRGWDAARERCRVEFPRTKSVRGYDEWKERRLDCKKALEKLSEQFSGSSEELLSDMRTMAPVVRELLELVIRFDAEYSREKRRRNLLDFSDQEHLTVQLLADPETGLPTATARTLSGRYTEILVDEYQDVNAVQELIFRMISKDGGNLFMVGDVKQSIYRFRLADPTIFLQKYGSFADYGCAAEGEPRKVVLSRNFRSRAGILAGVNFVFSQVMSRDFGEMDYTEREYLYPGASYPVGDGREIELCVLDMDRKNADPGEELPETTEAEAEFIAERVERLLAEGTVSDGSGGMRPVRCGDIAILLRSMAGRAGQYAAALEKRGIPVTADNSEGFFETVEITVILSLLEIIDNPYQDVPLISVLRSPVYGFTANELALIRLDDRKSDFYTALRLAAEHSKKCRDFLEELEGYRLAAPDRTAAQLIWEIYNKTGMLGIMGAMHGGERRRQNLLLLFRYAAGFQSSGGAGLFAFISAMQELAEKKKSPPFVEAAEGEAVRILSDHKSKGLEYPVVILASMAKKMNREDQRKPLLVHAELGVGPKCRDLEWRIEYPTIARQAVALKLEEESKAEELRVLYVAMTRAREKLIMVCTYPNAADRLAKLRKLSGYPLSPQALQETDSFADWVLLPALSRSESEVLREGASYVPAPDDGFRWDVHLVSTVKAQNAGREVPAGLERPAPSPEETEAIAERLGYVYPYAAAEEVPSKLTATQLKGRYADAEAAEDAGAQPEPARTMVFRRPDFVTGKGALSGAEKGTALHLAMQYIDYARCGDESGIRAELRRLREGRYLTAAQAEAVPPRKLSTFFRSDLGKRVLGAEKLYREFKFSLLVPASDYVKDCKDGEILLQGVVDCCIEEEDGLTVIDYKTDYVTEELLREKVSLYKTQIDAYSQAIGKITGKSVKEKLLYFFALDKAVAVD